MGEPRETRALGQRSEHDRLERLEVGRLRSRDFAQHVLEQVRILPVGTNGRGQGHRDQAFSPEIPVGGRVAEQRTALRGVGGFPGVEIEAEGLVILGAEPIASIGGMVEEREEIPVESLRRGLAAPPRLQAARQHPPRPKVVEQHARDCRADQGGDEELRPGGKRKGRESKQGH